MAICIIGGVLALMFGYIAKGQIDRSGGSQGGRGMAIAGIVLGWVGIGLGIIYIVLVIALVVSDSDTSNSGMLRNAMSI